MAAPIGGPRAGVRVALNREGRVLWELINDESRCVPLLPRQTMNKRDSVFIRFARDLTGILAPV